MKKLLPFWPVYLFFPLFYLLGGQSLYWEEFRWVFPYFFALYYESTGFLFLVFFGTDWLGGFDCAVSRFKVQPKKRYSWGQFGEELLFSLSSVFVGSTFVAFVCALWRAGRTALYEDLGEVSPLFYAASVLVMVLANDFYMFFSHYWLHNPAVYGGIHKVHHKFPAPSPISTMAFHPLEALVQFAPLLALTVFPMHLRTLQVFAGILFYVSVFEHNGYSILFIQELLDFLHISSTAHHDLHHEKYQCNYAVYFTFWDSIWKTKRIH